MTHIWKTLQSWIKPSGLFPYVVANPTINGLRIRRRFMSIEKARAYCEDLIDLRGDNVDVYEEWQDGVFTKSKR